MNTRTEQVEGLIARFPHIPREAVFKEHLLRTGMAFDDSALTDNLEGEVKPKSYFIFSFDQKPLAQLGNAAKRRPPEEIALTGGPDGVRRTTGSGRLDPHPPAPRARRGWRGGAAPRGAGRRRRSRSPAGRTGCGAPSSPCA